MILRQAAVDNIQSATVGWLFFLLAYWPCKSSGVSEEKLTFLECSMKSETYLLVAGHLCDGVSEEKKLVIGLECILISLGVDGGHGETRI